MDRSPFQYLQSTATMDAKPMSPPQRIRRKRMTIEIPDHVLEGVNSPEEVRKLKNRIAAARLRERSQAQVLDLQQQVEFYKQRCEYLESVVAQCGYCSGTINGPQTSMLEPFPVAVDNTPMSDSSEEEAWIKELDREMFESILVWSE